MRWILRYSAKRRFNMMDVLANVSFWTVTYSYGTTYGLFCWLAFMVLSSELESIYFPEYSKSPEPVTPPKQGS